MKTVKCHNSTQKKIKCGVGYTISTRFNDSAFISKTKFDHRVTETRISARPGGAWGYTESYDVP